MNTVQSLFHIKKGHQLALNQVAPANDLSQAVAYVARSHRNNGVTAFVQPIEGLEPAPAGSISVCLRSRNHSLSAFVQPRPFYTTYHVAVLTPKVPMSIQEKLWWCLCIRANRFRFNFGRQANRTISSLILPDKAPSWVDSVEIPSREKYSAKNPLESLRITSWKPFPLIALFSLHVGKHTIRRDLGIGDTPLVTASAWKNGVTAHVSSPPDWPGGQITVASNGSIGSAFFQPMPFTASRDVIILNPKERISSAVALFICTIIRKEGAKYNYARKWNFSRMCESEIRLPTNKGKIDTAFMERFMQGLRFSWALEKTSNL